MWSIQWILSGVGAVLCVLMLLIRYRLLTENPPEAAEVKEPSRRPPTEVDEADPEEEGSEEEGSEEEADEEPEEDAEDEEDEPKGEETATKMPPSFAFQAAFEKMNEERIARLVEERLRQREEEEARRKANEEAAERRALEPTEADAEFDLSERAVQRRVETLLSFIEKPWWERKDPQRGMICEIERNANGARIAGYWNALIDMECNVPGTLNRVKDRIHRQITSPPQPAHKLYYNDGGQEAGSLGDMNVYAGFSKLPAHFWTQSLAHDLFRKGRIPISKVLLRYRTAPFCLEHMKAGKLFLWDVPVDHRDKDLCVLALKMKRGGLADVPPNVRTAPEFVNACTQENISF